ncbi:MAG TPA: aminoglycoside 6-adenylyltransferase [Thermomicrobiales bacterium]|nr:aminoglycoside 6-adenylyltransferase [Thermomicrobiales bacterium]
MRTLPADHTAAYAGIIERIVAWIADEPRVRAAMIVGSRARTDHPADAWSDLDVVLFATDPDALLAEHDWIHRIGAPVITFLERTAVGAWQERRALFAGALDVDFSIVPAAFLAAASENPAVLDEIRGVLARGVRVLEDKDGALGRVLAAVTGQPAPVPPPPDQARLDQIVSDFWYHVVWIAKKLRRGELAVAHECLDGHQRRLLLSLVRWHAEKNGPIWHGTRYLEEWVDPATRDALAATWARHDAADVARATRAMMDLFSRLAAGVAAHHGLTVPPGAEPAARAWWDAITRDSRQHTR